MRGLTSHYLESLVSSADLRPGLSVNLRSESLATGLSPGGMFPPRTGGRKRLAAGGEEEGSLASLGLVGNRRPLILSWIALKRSVLSSLAAV